MGSLIRLRGTVIVAGAAQGEVLAGDEPLSFWGGYDPGSGEIIDRRHPLSGSIGAGRILSIPNGRGSCSASGVLLEAIRNGLAPAAIIVSRIDPIIGLGSILGDELYGRPIPLIMVTPEDRALIRTGDVAAVSPDGSVEATRN